MDTKALRAKIQQLDSSLSTDLITTFLERAGVEYHQTFSADQVAEHLGLLASLRGASAFRIHREEEAGGPWNVALAIPDWWGALAIVSGLLTIHGWNILEALTVSLPVTEREMSKALQLFRIKQLAGQSEEAAAWREFERDLGLVLSNMQRGQENQVREGVYRRAIFALQRREAQIRPLHHPVELKICPAPEEPWTILEVMTQDEPGFLHLFSNLLSMRQLFIHKVAATSRADRVHNVFSITDRQGLPLTREEDLKKLRSMVILAKKFHSVLAQVPDPAMALHQFDVLLDDLLVDSELPQDYQFLEEPKTLGILGKVAGTSEYLWNAFIRIEHESLVRFLDDVAALDRVRTRGELFGDLERQLKERSYEDRQQVLRRFRNERLFVAILRHLLGRSSISAFGEEMSDLADAVLIHSIRAAEDKLRMRYGTPRDAAGQEIRLGVFGLGKLGGRELGVSSDLEVLFVFAGNGETDGEKSVDLAQFFTTVVQEFLRFHAVSESETFAIDLRLRPHGNKGALATSLAQLGDYYREGGMAQEFERQAWVRLRPITGESELISEVLAVRDGFVYSGIPLDLEGIAHLRKRQVSEFVPDDYIHTKYSLGALVDVEYYVQYLQVRHGVDEPRLRLTNSEAALDALHSEGLLSSEEHGVLLRAYYFWRRLIDALRIEHGNANDLTLPLRPNEKLSLLARRMEEEAVGDGSSLLREISRHRKAVREVTQDWVRSAFLTPLSCMLFDPAPDRARVERGLARLGFTEPRRATEVFFQMAGEESTRQAFSLVWTDAEESFRISGEPDRALRNWRRFMEQVGSPLAHLIELAEYPFRRSLLLKILGVSQYLADILIRNPQYFSWLVDSGDLEREKSKEDFLLEIGNELVAAFTYEGKLDALRRYKRRELLRIGARDYAVDVGLEATTRELSAMADGLIQAAWQVAEEKRSVGGAKGTVLAFGKLGGAELNYSSDVDLLFVFDVPLHDRPMVTRFAETIIEALTRHTGEGFLFRVDMRLRPYGGPGELVSTPDSLKRYYRENASDWELQALIKARPVVGEETGRTLLEDLAPLIYRSRPSQERFLRVKRKAEDQVRQRGEWTTNVKLGRGGIRDVEYITQLLQLQFGERDPSVRSLNTLEGIERLTRGGLLPRGDAQTLEAAYRFLRCVEHVLQIYDNQQVHVLPEDPEALERIARRVYREDAPAWRELRLGPRLENEFGRHTQAVRQIFEALFPNR